MRPNAGVVIVALTLMVLAGSLQAPVLAQGEITSDATPVGGPANPPGAPIRVEGDSCVFIDFESVGNRQPIGTVGGNPEVAFGPGWVGLVDEDAGGGGNFANEPSPDTIAIHVFTEDPINFSPAIQTLDGFYTASSVIMPITLSAWDGPDGTGNLVESILLDTVGNSVDGANCSGDPTGDFCLFDTFLIGSAGVDILSVTITTTGVTPLRVGFDDFTACIINEVPTLPNVGWMLVFGLILVSGAALVLRQRARLS